MAIAVLKGTRISCQVVSTRLPSLTPYVALSYVWGSVKVLKAFKSNVEDLKRPGALAKDDIGIPDTIRDAMHLVKSLGERYLWVDCT
jgi:hypothetical protein